jgi:hypothetical protein
MITEIFRSNNPLLIILYVLLILLLRAGLLIFQPEELDLLMSSEPLSKIIYNNLKYIPVKYDLLQLFIGLLLQLVQAIHLNHILSENKIIPRRNYISGLIFILFTSLLPEYAFPGPAMLSLSVYILISGWLFSLFKSDKPYARIYNIGFLASLNLFIYFPSALFLLYVMIGLLIMRPFILREWILLLLGIISPIYLAFSWYYLNDSLPDFSQTQLINAAGLQLPKQLGQWIVLLNYLILTGLSVLFLPASLFGGLIQVRKFAGLMFAFLLLVLLSFIMRQENSYTHLVLLSLPLSVVFSLLIENSRSTLFPDLFILLMFAVIGITTVVLPIYSSP